jgi:hypothetical protein
VRGYESEGDSGDERDRRAPKYDLTLLAVWQTGGRSPDDDGVVTGEHDVDEHDGSEGGNGGGKLRVHHEPVWLIKT